MENELNIYRRFYKGFEYWIIRPSYMSFKNIKNNIPFHLCGYITIDKDSEHFISNDYEDYNIKCHWGLTYAGSLEYLSVDFAIGFDCAHYGDKIFNYEGDLEKINDNAIYRDVNFVDIECKSIIDQLIGEK